MYNENIDRIKWGNTFKMLSSVPGTQQEVLAIVISNKNARVD